MVKISPIKKMEEFLLQDSKTFDLIAAGDTKAKSPNTKLTVQQVRHDVSVFARVLINVYSGWPFHDEILKRKILRILIKIHKNAHDMTSLELLEQLRPAVEIIPDNHISLRMIGHDKGVRTGLRKLHPNVGSNIAGDKKFVVELKNDIGIIGIRTLFKWTTEEKEKFEQQWQTMLPKAKILIIDLRDNNGGSDRPTIKLTSYILGYHYPAARRVFIRNNPDANAVKKLYESSNGDKFNIKSDEDPVIFKDDSKNTLPEFDAKKAGFDGPIYVLINGKVMSAGEVVCTQMLNYPNVKFIGTNTCGGEVYGYNYAYILLPHSKMTFNVGCVYREMFVKNFELNGYKPDIECKDGQDAFDVALLEYANQNGADKSAK